MTPKAADRSSDRDGVVLAVPHGSSTRVAVKRWSLVALLILLCAAVVNGARWNGELDGSRELAEQADSPDLSVATDTTQLVIGVLIVVLFVTIAVTLFVGIDVRAILVFLGIVLLIALVAFMLESTPVELDTGVVAEDGFDSAGRAIDASKVPSGVGLGVAVVALIIGAVLVRRRRRTIGPVRTVNDEIGDVASVLRRDPAADDRTAIIEAYEQLEHVLARSGRPRRSDETTAEHLQRVLGSAVVGNELDDDIAALGQIYQDAAFGHGDARIAVRLAADRHTAAATLDAVAAQFDLSPSASTSTAAAS